MAFPVVESTATSQSNTAATAQSATLPSGIASGDLLVLFIRHAATTTIAAPSGWTNLSNAASFNAFYRVADGSESASVAFTISVASRHASVAYRISGYTGTPEASSQASSYDVPSLAPSWGSADTLWLATVGVLASDYTINAAPTDYTDLLEIGNPSSSATSRMRIGSARRNLASSSDDPGSFTVSGGSATLPVSVLVAIQGTAAGGAALKALGLLGVGN